MSWNRLDPTDRPEATPAAAARQPLRSRRRWPGLIAVLGAAGRGGLVGPEHGGRAGGVADAGQHGRPPGAHASAPVAARGGARRRRWFLPGRPKTRRPQRQKWGPDQKLLELIPQAGSVGWVRSNDSRNNHFGDSYIYTGISQGDIFHGAIQFDLSGVARGAPISYAALALTGLDDARLNRSSDATWQVRWLDPALNESWGRLSFQEIHNARIVQTLLPAIGQADLASDARTVFLFDEQQIAALQQALIDEQSQIVFRIDGPEAGAENLFAWDTGYGPQSAGSRPQLVLVVGPAPGHAAGRSRQRSDRGDQHPHAPERADGRRQPGGRHSGSQPARHGHADPAQHGDCHIHAGEPDHSRGHGRHLGGDADADASQPGHHPARRRPTPRLLAMTTGTWTPTPSYFVAATATPTFVIITNTPTPNSASALLAWAVAEATRVRQDGPPTAIPPGFITATPRFIIATGTPTPANAATAQAIRVLATVAALTTGTYTPMPAVITPTPAATATRNRPAAGGDP
jgi:hypothetical protein